MLFSSLCLLLLSASAIAHGPARPQKHQHVKKRFEIDDRGLPITATTTIRVQKTLIETIWVQPTGQVVFEPTSVAASASASASPSASELLSESSSAVQSASASESASATVSEVPSASASESAVASSIEQASSSSSPFEPSQSAISSESATSSDSASASPSITESSSPSESSEVVSVSASRSASRTNRPSGSATASAEPTSNESSASESATSSDSASASPSITESSSSSEPSETSSVSASRSASRTNRPSGSTSVSSSTESVSAEPTSTEVSASESASASSSLSRSASRSNRNSATASSSTATSESTSSAEARSTSSSSASVPSATHVAGQVRSGLLMNGYYPDWASWKLAPENVDWSKFDVIDFAFAIPTAEFGLVFTQDNSASLLNRLVASAHAAGKFVKLSIGGWTGSVHFSDACRTFENRQTFIGHIVDAYYAYNLDGIDLDWEYPGTGGAWNNVVTGQDSANFLFFLQELRAALPQGALITAATQVWPFADENGNPMGDVSAFAKVLDWILIMNYDIWGSAVNGEKPGPNAPLKTCDGSGQRLANAYAAISSWTTAGFPANQITLGVPAYGYLSKSSAWSLRHRRGNKPQRRADVTILNDNGGTSDGQIQFWNLVAQGALVRDGSGNYVGAGGFTRSWDDCSQTPWIRSGSSGQIVTYDDPQSLSLKGQFAAQVGLRGCNVFSMDGDVASGELVQSVRSGMGI